MAFNVAMIVFPENLSYDWQMGSIPLITSFRDPRNLLTLTILASILIICYKCRSLIFDVIKSALTSLVAAREPEVFRDSCHLLQVSHENDEVSKTDPTLIRQLSLRLSSILFSRSDWSCEKMLRSEGMQTIGFLHSMLLSLPPPPETVTQEIQDRKFLPACLPALYPHLSQDREENGLLVVGLCMLVLGYLPASNSLVTVGFVVAERILYVPR